MLARPPSVRTSSMPSVIYPIADMVAACHKRGVRVMVDGAHAPGQLPLDVAAVGADWYTGNLHKWSFTSKVGRGTVHAPQRNDCPPPPWKSYSCVAACACVCYCVRRSTSGAPGSSCGRTSPCVSMLRLCGSLMIGTCRGYPCL